VRQVPKDSRSGAPMTVPDFRKKKAAGEKIAMVTCYDTTSALILNATSADCLLVGDSLGMTMLGFSSTLPVTVEMMALSTAAVARGARNKFIIGDLPFASYRKSLSESVAAATALMQAGAHAVKLEGAAGNAETVKHLVESGIPVMGHIGLTPQFVNQLGGWRVQGKTEEGAKRLMAEALALEKAGCFAIVLECVPAKLAKAITRKLKIATIGIGAGRDTDGQVLVFQDLLGLNTAFKPKFVKHFINGAEIITNAIEEYADEVRTGKFPGDENSF
jgi:3-methyl-2-oxobutanoate hydroxymethyltransferase